MNPTPMHLKSKILQRKLIPRKSIPKPIKKKGELVDDLKYNYRIYSYTHTTSKLASPIKAFWIKLNIVEIHYNS